MEKIIFEPAPGQGKTVECYVLEEATLKGVEYILVTEADEGKDGEALILKDVGGGGGADATYEVVTDENELDAIVAVFNSLLEEDEIEQ